MMKTSNRTLGILLITKTLIPPAVFVAILMLLYSMTSGTSAIAKKSYNDVNNNLSLISQQSTILKSEVLRLKKEIEVVKTEAKQFSKEVQNAIRPIAATLKGVQSAILAVLGGVAAVINEVGNGIRKISFGAIKIGKINLSALRRINLVPIKFPELDVNLAVNTESIEEITRLSKEMGMNIQQSGNELLGLFSFWGKLVGFIFFAIFIWFSIFIVGYFLRMIDNLKRGWALIKGESSELSWRLL